MKRWRFARIPTPMLGLAASLVIASTAAAQGTATIRGTVTDSATGQPIENVQVTIPGTTTGTLTDVQGRYTLGNVTAGTLTVRAQVIGYTQGERQITVAAGDTATANFGLRQTAVQLGGVVVVGYGTENRSQVTGAVTTVSGADVANTPVAGVDAALQGKAPGVQVTQNSGDPGNGISVRVRGAASISASNQPLYVVDGVPVQSEDFAQLSPSGQGLTAITGLDPNDIASITVLKDAASAAIYGSRASNGVVMITTKRGQAGKARFTLDAYTGWQNVAHRLSLMNAQQYVAYMNEGADNDGEDEPFTSLTDTTYGYDDWQSAIFRTAPVSNIHLGVSGGTDQLRYFVDGSYFDQDGVVLGSKYNRTNARVNVDYNASNRLSLKTSIGLSHENDNRIEGDNSDNGVVTNAVGEPPIYPYRTATGAFTNPDDFDEFIYTNPVAIGAYDRLPTITDRVLGNVEGNYDFNPHFTLTGRLGADVLHMREDQWQSPLVVGTYAFGASGVAKSGYNNANRYLMESFLTYRGGADSAGSWNIVGGASVEYNHQELNFIRGEGFSSPDFHYVRDAASVVEYDGIPFDHNLVSYFARANY
ncbi:MAG TPA: SusC/RagA family TonB-linked outer membrane protein, partial [Gemmatimonadaceae bacterium]|nr:SusC/RagA family TonB-linked outer membrane protein [Gemmatimonadaceae bacterium]